MSDKISLENVLRRCGDLGRYQLVHYIFLNFIAVGSGINAFYYVFGVAEPLFRCRIPLNVWPGDDQFHSINATHQRLIDIWQSPTSKCENINGSRCNDFVYDRSVFGRTFTEEANFVCDNAVKRTWLATAYQIGACSALLTGILGDKIGRRKVIQLLNMGIFVISVLTQLLLQFVRMAVDIKFALLIVNQTVSSMVAYGMVFLLLMEMTSSSHTTLAGNLALISYTLGEILATIFAYVTHDWLKLKWFNSGYFVLVLAYLYFLPESPYWLFSRKRFNQLEVCLRKIATTNRRADSEWFPHYIQLTNTPCVTITVTQHGKRDRIARLVPRLSIGGFIGFVTMLLYIKVSYGLAAMNAILSPHWSIIIGAVVESIGYVSASFLMTTRLGRKYAFVFYALFTAGCVLVIPFIRDAHPVVTLILSQMGKLAISGAVSVSWIYVPELFPTSMRGLGNAALVFVGRFGAILAPIVDAALGDRYIKLTFYVYAALALVMVGLVVPLPETRNRSFDDGNIDPDKTPTEVGDKSRIRTAVTNTESDIVIES